MESKHRQAAAYAEQNANFIISKAIEEVYKAGYETGCKDSRESSVIYDYQETVEFIDLTAQDVEQMRENRRRGIRVGTPVTTQQPLPYESVGLYVKVNSGTKRTNVY